MINEPIEISENKNIQNQYIIALILITGFLLSILMFFLLQHGSGVTPDSTIYMDAAESFMSGKGFKVDGEFMTHYPPFYPILLAIVGYFTADILVAAKYLTSFFYGVNFVLLVTTVFILTKFNKLILITVSIFYVLSLSILSIHSMAWTEAPYITFLLLV